MFLSTFGGIAYIINSEGGGVNASQASLLKKAQTSIPVLLLRSYAEVLYLLFL